MEWAPQQDRALGAVRDWLRRGDEPVFRLFGYAGTGKTTLARHFTEGVEGQVMFGAYTGKAAHVLRQKGCPDASTIHSMIYHAKERGRATLQALENELAEVLAEIRHDHDGDVPAEVLDDTRAVRNLRGKIRQARDDLARPSFTLNRESGVRDAALVVIDECSMVDERMGHDLLSFETPVLVLGDPAQLPPVRGTGFFTDNGRPDAMLTDIHRQARGNPIIEMATRARNEEALATGDYGDSRVVDKADLDADEARELALATDQILVGRNVTRRASNRRMRAVMGRRLETPEPGDRLVCLRNDHDAGLLNGAIWHVRDMGEVGDDLCVMTIHGEDGGSDMTVEAHTPHFLGKGDTIPYWSRRDAQEFDYGYALTVHKAQGSQWGDVLLFDESHCFRADRWRWLYTGITRAAERLTVCLM